MYGNVSTSLGGKVKHQFPNSIHRCSLPLTARDQHRTSLLIAFSSFLIDTHLQTLPNFFFFNLIFSNMLGQNEQILLVKKLGLFFMLGPVQNELTFEYLEENINQ